MSVTRQIAAAAAGAALVAGVGLALAPASASQEGPGSTPLAAGLTADGNRFDRNSDDFDIVTEAVLAVLADNPDSPVGVLTQGDVAATAFLPTDGAFRQLVFDLTHRWVSNEEKVFEQVAGLGLDTVEDVLLYHVVPGATVTSTDAFASDDAALATALVTESGPATVTVQVRHRLVDDVLRLRDNDRNARDPRVTSFDINIGNSQIAHGIDRVLRPVDL
jgi:uncharacterized surface protein with fasciclin (FAS1) repeats